MKSLSLKVVLALLFLAATVVAQEAQFTPIEDQYEPWTFATAFIHAVGGDPWQDDNTGGPSAVAEKTTYTQAPYGTDHIFAKAQRLVGFFDGTKTEIKVDTDSLGGAVTTKAWSYAQSYVGYTCTAAGTKDISFIPKVSMSSQTYVNSVLQGENDIWSAETVHGFGGADGWDFDWSFQGGHIFWVLSKTGEPTTWGLIPLVWDSGSQRYIQQHSGPTVTGTFVAGDVLGTGANTGVGAPTNEEGEDLKRVIDASTSIVF